MRNTTISALAALSLASTGLGSAVQATENKGHDHSKMAMAPGHVAMTAQDIVAIRQASMFTTAASFGGIKGSLDRGEEPGKLGFVVAGLVRFAKSLPALFPAGSEMPNSRALPAIWNDRTGFDAASANFLDAALKLQAAVKANDAAVVLPAWEGVRNACQACHDRYQKPAMTTPPPANKPAG